jgi:hypothetical protein
VADDAVITFGGRSIDFKHVEGAIEYTEAREYEYETDRGELDSTRQLDDVPMDVSAVFIWDFLTAADTDTVPTVEDVLHYRELATTWESTDTEGCGDFAFDIQIEFIPPCGGLQREIITLPNFRWEELSHDAGEASIAISGRCNATVAEVERRDSE